MPVAAINSGADNVYGVLLETSPGVLEQAPYEQILTTGPTLGYPSTEAVALDVGDRGGPTGRRRHSKGADWDAPMMFRHIPVGSGNRLLEEHAWRDDYTAEFSYTGAGAAGDLDLVLAGTKFDTTSGIQIVAPLNTFAAMKGGVGEGALVLLRDWATPDNNQAFRAEAVWDDTVNDFIDIPDVYGAGSASDPMGAPFTAEAGVAASVHFGEILKNKQKGAAGRRTLSMLVERCQHVIAGQFRAASGGVANDWAIDSPDEGAITLTIPVNARDWTASSMTPQNGETPPAHFVDNLGDRQFMLGGEDLENLSIFGYVNAANPTPTPVLLGNTGVNSFNWTLAGNVNVIQNILGMTGVFPRRGLMDMTGSMGLFVMDDVAQSEVERLGDPANHYQAAIHAIWRDPDGYRKSLTLMRNEFASTGGEGQGDGEEAMTMEFGSVAISPLVRAAALQQFDNTIV